MEVEVLAVLEAEVEVEVEVLADHQMEEVVEVLRLGTAFERRLTVFGWQQVKGLHAAMTTNPRCLFEKCVGQLPRKRGHTNSSLHF